MPGPQPTHCLGGNYHPASLVQVQDGTRDVQHRVQHRKVIEDIVLHEDVVVKGLTQGAAIAELEHDAHLAQRQMAQVAQGTIDTVVLEVALHICVCCLAKTAHISLTARMVS